MLTNYCSYALSKCNNLNREIAICSALYKSPIPSLNKEESPCNNTEADIISQRLLIAKVNYSPSTVRHINISSFPTHFNALSQIKSKYPTIYSHIQISVQVISSPTNVHSPDISKIYNIKKETKCLFTSPLQRLSTSSGTYSEEKHKINAIKDTTLIDYLILCIEYLRETESIKHELSLQPDFDFLTLMHLISQVEDYISLINLYEYLIENDIKFVKEGVLLIFARYDSSGTKHMSLSDFIDMLQPISHKMACLMKDKSSMRSTIDEEHKQLSSNTQALFNNLIIAAIKHETILQGFRQKRVWGMHKYPLEVAKELCEVDKNNSSRVIA
jgi:hypothetical protein